MRDPSPGIQLRSVYKVPERTFAVGLDLTALTLVYVFMWAAFIVEASPGAISRALIVVLGVMVLILYYAIFEAAFSWTPGKLLTGLRVVDKATLGKPSFLQALTRNLLRPVDALFGYLVGFIVAEASTYRQRIGDHVAGTLVIDCNFREHIREAEGLERRKQAGARAEQRVSHELGKLPAFDGDYYVWNDLYEDGVGNIDHLVVGPGGATIVETKSHRGVVRVEGQGPPTVDGKPLERNVLNQVRNQRRAVARRMGLGDTDPDKVAGFNWLICFPRGELDNGLDPNVRRWLATTRDLRGKIRSQPRTATPEQLLSMARAVEELYGREPDHSPSGPGEADPDGPAQARKSSR